jgi:hypothetical protein
MLSGPEIRLRLDFASFQHVVASAQDRIRRWRLCAGRDADAVQFIPDFDFLPGVNFNFSFDVQFNPIP